MSSHREAPGISKDPVADNTDLYAFVSPDLPNTVTIIANFIPLEAPASGPNFWEFGDDVLYEIHIDNDADALAEITYQFRFTTTLQNPNTFLYNTGPIGSNTDPNFNRRQTYSVTRVRASEPNSVGTVLGSNLSCPPVNVGVRSISNYGALANAAIYNLPSGETVFAGQRIEGFYVDLGSIFDLAALRPFNSAHLIHPPNNAPGVNATANVNVHSIAIQIPKTMLTPDGSNPSNQADQKSVIGVWATASRYKTLVRGDNTELGPWVQVSRLGNPLFNEVLVPMSKKDAWNLAPPSADSNYASGVTHPELQGLLPVLYPGVFPNLAAYSKPRADLAAIFLTGIPTGVVSGFQNYTGSTQADLLRLNMAIAPTTSNPNPLGVVGGDLAGWPNGRRVIDDVATVAIRGVAGVTIPLVDPSYTPDGAASAVSDFMSSQVQTIVTSNRYLNVFPYLGLPLDGYDVPAA